MQDIRRMHNREWLFPNYGFKMLLACISSRNTSLKGRMWVFIA
uniref:Uncharacterized protein n=1 Tax=Arundo donax TaxID=35708 RepID=A0A0A9C7U9_ARUDO